MFGSVIQCFDHNNPLAVNWKCTSISLSQWDMSVPQKYGGESVKAVPNKDSKWYFVLQLH